jgi:hypothetical protein
MNLHPRAYLNIDRFLVFEGEVLQMQLWAERDVPVDALPLLGLEDHQEILDRVRLDDYLDGIPAGRWTTLRIPLDVFDVKTGDGRVQDPRRPTRIFFEQWLDDGEPHTVYVDDIRIVPAGVPAKAGLPREASSGTSNWHGSAPRGPRSPTGSSGRQAAGRTRPSQFNSGYSSVTWTGSARRAARQVTGSGRAIFLTAARKRRSLCGPKRAA